LNVRELSAILKENGVAYRPEAKKTPILFR